MITVTENIIEEEIVKLVRSDQVLRLLGDLSVLRRQKLRAHRGIENIVEYICQGLVAAGIRVVADKMTNKRLRNRRVHAVHGHVVSVVGRPAKSQLRHISCSDDHAVRLVRKVHEDQGAVSCLGVLVSHIMDRRIMSDILEVGGNCFSDIYFF